MKRIIKSVLWAMAILYVLHVSLPTLPGTPQGPPSDESCYWMDRY